MIPQHEVYPSELEKKKKNKTFKQEWHQGAKLMRIMRVSRRRRGVYKRRSQRGGREVVVLPEIFVVLHHTADQVKERLAPHLAGEALQPWSR